jgi:RNA polymerase sigma factor (TIGR02999 family)
LCKVNPDMNEVTRIINAIQQGNRQATEELLPLVYDELRLLAAQKLAREAPGHTLQATALVHEAYLRLIGSENSGWEGRGHFFAAAAEAMRRIPIDNARRKKGPRHGGHLRQMTLNESLAGKGKIISDEDLLALHEALNKFEEKDQLKAELVKLRFFAGLSGEQAAKLLGISYGTEQRYWAYARSWLKVELRGTDRQDEGQVS